MPTLLTFIGIIGAVVAPVLYVGAIRETVAVNSNRISTLEASIGEIKADNKEILSLIRAHTFEVKKLPMLVATSTASK